MEENPNHEPYNPQFKPPAPMQSILPMQPQYPMQQPSQALMIQHPGMYQANVHQPGVMIVNPSPPIYNVSGKAIVGISISHILIGAFTFIFNIVSLCYYAGVSVIGHGIWGGIFVSMLFS